MSAGVVDARKLAFPAERHRDLAVEPGGGRLPPLPRDACIEIVEAKFPGPVQRQPLGRAETAAGDARAAEFRIATWGPEHDSNKAIASPPIPLSHLLMPSRVPTGRAGLERPAAAAERDPGRVRSRARNNACRHIFEFVTLSRNLQPPCFRNSTGAPQRSNGLAQSRGRDPAARLPALRLSSQHSRNPRGAGCRRRHLRRAFTCCRAFGPLTTLHGSSAASRPTPRSLLSSSFRPEMRRALRYMALQFAPKKRPSGAIHYEYEDVIFAATQLAQSKVGALIVIERETGLRTFIQSGVALDARLSSDLLVSVFQRTSPLARRRGHHPARKSGRGGLLSAADHQSRADQLARHAPSRRHRHHRRKRLAGYRHLGNRRPRSRSPSAGSIDIGVSIDRLRLKLIQYFGPVVAPPRDVSASGILLERPEENLASGDRLLRRPGKPGFAKGRLSTAMRSLREN